MAVWLKGCPGVRGLGQGVLKAIVLFLLPPGRTSVFARHGDAQLSALSERAPQY